MRTPGRIVFFLCIVMCWTTASGQGKYVSITIDDVPLAVWPEDTPFDEIKLANNKILNIITKNKVPVAAFVNEGRLAQGDQTEQRIQLLKQWIDNPYVTIGNHTFSHPNYAQTDRLLFEQDVVEGEKITRKLLTGTNKKLEYFRFPYNATGKDSVSRYSMELFLTKNGYIIAPFTIESADYLFNTLYMYALSSGDKEKAHSIGMAYVDFTLLKFEYFESFSNQYYERVVNQIYLCHDNALNAAYLGELINGLKNRGYSFIDLKTVMTDNVYSQNDYYFGPYGFSWFYRWEKDEIKRKQMLRGEPDPDKEFLEAYERAGSN